MNNYKRYISNPRNPTKKELDQLINLELKKLDDIRRQNGHCSYDEGDLDFMIRNASIVVFDTFNPTPAPGQYSGKLLTVVWSIHSTTHYVWLDDTLIEVTNDNQTTIR